MNPSNDTVRLALALGADDQLREVAAEAAPVTTQHARGEGLLDLAALLRSRPTPVQVHLGVALVVHHYVGHAGVVAVDAPGAVTPLLGDTRPDDDGLVLDGRIRPAAARVVGPEGEHVVIAHGPLTRILQVTRAARAPRDRAPSALALLGAATVERSLRERLAALEGTGEPLDRVAALGTVQRLWAPVGRELRLAALRGEPGPAESVRAWVAGLGPEPLAALGRQAVSAVEDLRQRLAEPADPRTPADEVARALALVDRRDALESVLTVLASRAAHGEVLPLLERLDAQATAAWTELPPAGVLGALPWLAEVAVALPGAWWAAFGER